MMRFEVCDGFGHCVRTEKSDREITLGWYFEEDRKNLGDELAHYLIEYFTGAVPTFAVRAQYYVIGSIIFFASTNHGDGKTNGTVWGCGMYDSSHIGPVCLNYTAVRGPNTRKVLLAKGCNVPNVIGDPVELSYMGEECYCHLCTDLGKMLHGLLTH